MKVPEKYRKTNGVLRSDSRAGNNGCFIIPLSHRTTAIVIASDGQGWEHVSVHAVSDAKERTPTWAEMCKIKEVFWEDEETVIQYHPPKSEHINNHKYCLHLWKPVGMEIPLPDSILVGFQV